MINTSAPDVRMRMSHIRSEMSPMYLAMSSLSATRNHMKKRTIPIDCTIMFVCVDERIERYLKTGGHCIRIVRKSRAVENIRTDNIKKK